MKWLHRLEYKYGRYYIRNLMTIVVAGMVLVYLLDMFFQAGGFLFSNYIYLDIAKILQGQVWRLVTFVFMYPGNNAFLILINIYFFYILGQMLESMWGGFRLNVYYLFGILGTWLAAIFSYLIFGIGVGINSYLNLSLFLAVAALAPDTTFRLFFMIPIKAKWLAVGYGVLMLVPLLQAFIFGNFVTGMIHLINLLFSLLNFAIFFGPTLIGGIREQARIAKNQRNWKNNWR